MSDFAGRRFAALFALAFVLFAALPCAVAATPGSCCGAAAGCADEREAPCGRLSAAPCCGARQEPVEQGVSAKLGTSAAAAGEVLVPPWPSDAPAPLRVSRLAEPRADQLAQRSAVLRL